MKILVSCSPRLQGAVGVHSASYHFVTCASWISVRWSQSSSDKWTWLTDRVLGMTGDARRLLAWKGLGGTPATVFTITFPPTVAGRNKEEWINRWNTSSSVMWSVCVCVSTHQPGGLCPQWHFLWLQYEKHEMFVLEKTSLGKSAVI